MRDLLVREVQRPLDHRAGLLRAACASLLAGGPLTSEAVRGFLFDPHGVAFAAAVLCLWAAIDKALAEERRRRC